jgi:hypothetical protein
MKNRVGKNKADRVKTQTSMSNASKSICQKEECIGGLIVADREDSIDNSKGKKKNKKSITRSSMKFGNKASCTDEECIGKT